MATSQSARRLSANDKRILRAISVSALGISPWDSSRTVLIYGPERGTMERYAGSVSCRRDTLKRLRDDGWLDARTRLTDAAKEAL